MKKTISIVTGANRGIGKETALGLATAGHEVVLACRNIAEATKARDEISQLSKNPQVFARELDLASFHSIGEFTKNFGSEFGCLDVLVNNAGVSMLGKERSAEGFEMNVGVNFFGTFALTNLLTPFFRPGSDCRVVNVVSGIYKIGAFDMERFNSYSWFKAYAVSKYMLLLYTWWLSDPTVGLGITANAVHPGIVRTSIMFTRTPLDIFIRLLLEPFFIDPAEGAKGSVFLATGKDIGSGRYYEGCVEKQVPARFFDSKKRDALMEYAHAKLQEFSSAKQQGERK
jgi:NAD(P)-dependent dehydrogenase (short-subunit alcohol dehydrogenase family)